MSTITKTTSNYPVKLINWNEQRNRYLGFVKDPIIGRPNINDGFVTNQWYKNGKCMDKTRPDLDLLIKL